MGPFGRVPRARPDILYPREIIVDTSPQEIESHAKVKTALYGELWDLLKEHDIGEVLTDDTLFVNEAADISNEPDLIFCSWESLQSGRVA